MLTRVSNTKLVDPDMVVAVERTFNKHGYTLKMVSGEEVFVSDEEYANLTFDNGNYDSKRVKSEIVQGTANLDLDDAFKSGSFVDLENGQHDAQNPTTCTLNLSSVLCGVHYQLTYWNSIRLTVTNDLGESTVIRHKNAKTTLADDATFTITMSTHTDGGIIVFQRANNENLYIINNDITITFN